MGKKNKKKQKKLNQTLIKMDRNNIFSFNYFNYIIADFIQRSDCAGY